MNRTVLTTLTLLLLAVPVSAEVSVTRLADGSVELFFEPGPGGPWESVREGVAEGDLLNPNGDVEGDSWPVTVIHPGTGRPDVVWSTGGEDREIYFSWHDGTAWRTPVNLSATNGADTLPALANDEHGNRFVVWNRERNSRDLVLVKALAGDDAAESSLFELSERHDTARRPVVAVHADGAAYVAYEEGHNGNDPVVYLALDEILIERDASGCLSDSGERPIDIARSATIVTEATPGDALHPEVHAESGKLWVDWLDGEGQLGWVELVDGAFTAKELVSIAEAGSEQAARADVRDQVLAP
jgi:hypothetical protein